MVLSATVFFQSFAQTYIGRQLVDQYPTTAWNTLTYGLTWLPTDYSTNTNQTYPLIIFLHGSGEGGDGVNGLWNLISQGLPQRIAMGWDPEAVNPVDGQNYKFIVVSPQAPGAAHWSYGFGQLPYILYDVVHRYRVDTSRIYVTGLSAGGAGTWACVTNTPEFARQFAAIIPVSAAGTNTPGEQANLPLVGGTYDVKVWNVCGANDAWYSFAQAATTTINTAIPAPTVPAIVTGLPGVGHEPNAWNTPYDPNWRNNSQGMNCFEWLLKYKRTSGGGALTVNAGSSQSVTLPANAVTVNGSATPAPGNSIASYAWSKVSGPSAYSIAAPGSSSTNITGLAQGSYTFRLTVTDNVNATATSDVSVTVNAAPNVLPAAQAGTDLSITLPVNSVILNGSGTDADGTIASYAWTKISGPAAYSIATPAQAQTAINSLVQGVYQFELKVTDNSGGIAKDTVAVTVNPAPNVAPSANAGIDQSITLPTNSASLNGSGTDPDGTIASYQWTKISGPASYAITNNTLAQTTATSLVQGVYQFELKVTDNSGASAKDTVSITVNPAPNVPPVANAGIDQSITLPINSVTLNGNGTDADGTISSYAWTKISGPASYSIATPAQAQTIINGLVQGVYQFELKVTDNSGTSAKDTISVTVNVAPNVVPVADAGVDQTITLPINSVTLTGSGSDADGLVSGYAWTKISGPASYTIVSATQAQTAITDLTAGVYAFELAVTDNDGATTKDTVLVTVNAAVPVNTAPVANAGTDIDITLPVDNATLNGSGTDADGTISTYQWTKIAGPASFIITSSTQAQTGINSLTEGSYQFELTVTDNDGATAKDTVTVTVHAAIPVNVPPIANAGNDVNITLPTDSVLLNGSGTDVDGTIASYAWTKISGPAQDSIGTPAQASTGIYHLVPGVYSYELTVTDNSGATATDTVVITVSPAPNVAPVAHAGQGQTITLPLDSVLLQGSGTDIDGTIASYHWTKLTGPAQDSIHYADSATTIVGRLVQGVYQYELTVTDDSGATARDTVVVTVNAPPVVDCHGVKRYMVPGSDGGKFITGDASVTGWYVPVNPGDTIVLRSQFAWSYFAMADYNGTSACPIVVTNEGGQVWLTAGIEAKNCQHLKITGGGDANTYYGFRIYNPGNDGNGVALSVQGKSGHIEIERADVYRKTYGVWAKQDPLCDQSYNYPNYVMDSIEIHHSRFKNIGQDCIYAGNTDPIGQRDIWCNGVLQHYIPMRISNINIHHLIIDSCMRTGIQISGADRGYNQVHDNIVTRCGYEYNQQQGTGISIGGMTVNCHVYNNYVRNTFLYGILSFGAGVNYIEHNDVDSSGWLDGVPNLISIPCNILASTKFTVPLDSSTLIIRYNKLGMGATPTTGNIVLTDWGPPTWTSNNVICNNTKQDGTPADFYVAPTVHYINDCSVSLPNMPPSANAGLDITLTPPTDSTRLQGSGSDPDGTIISYHWSKVNGPSQYTIAQPDQATTDLTNLVQGLYTFRLTVKDNDSVTATDDIQVSIAPPNVAPIANAGGDQILTLPLNSTTLQGSGFDPNGTIAGYLWTKISGPATFNIVNNISAQTQITGLVQGVYQFELRVVDDHGVPARDTINIIVNAAPPPTNVAPVAHAGADQTITLPTDFLTLNGSGTDADGTITAYQWTKISGPASYSFGSATSAQTSASSLGEGVYQFELKVTDDQGAVGRDTVTITVNAAFNVAPVSNAGPDRIITLPVNSLTIAGGGTDADGAIAAYHWTKISGPSSYIIVSPFQSQTTINGLTLGVYQFELSVTDNNGEVGKDTMSITVLPAPNTAPLADAGNDQTITLPVNSVTLNGVGTDADGNIASYQWTKVAGPASYSFGNASQPQTTVNGLTVGLYRFELTVTDMGGLVARDTLSVTVNPANIPPVANAGADRIITLPVNSLTITGSGSDADGTVTAYQWAKISGPSSFTIVSSAQAQTTLNGLVQGIYEFELTVTDNNGATGKDTVTVTVNPAPNVPPVANAGLDQVITLPANTVTLNGSGTDADGIIIFYQWSKISGPSTYTISSPNSAQTTLRNLVQGSYQFVLSVTDDQGAVNRDTVNVIVNAAPIIPNVPPVAHAGDDQTITLPVSGTTLSGSGTDVDGNIVGYLWTKVYGPASATIGNASAAQTGISNLTVGVYRFELKVTDNAGATAKDTVTITVVEDTRVSSSASLYPNPATSMIHVKIDALTHRNLTDINIYDARGVLVYSEEFLRTQQVMVKDINVAALLPGTYLIVINADINKTTTLKFVKQ